MKSANETVSDARTVDLVASAVLHTLSMSSIYSVLTATERVRDKVVAVVPIPAGLQWLGLPDFFMSLVAFLISFVGLVVDLNIMFVAQGAVNHAFNQDSSAQSRTRTSVVYPIYEQSDGFGSFSCVFGHHFTFRRNCRVVRDGPLYGLPVLEGAYPLVASSPLWGATIQMAKLA